MYVILITAFILGNLAVTFPNDEIDQNTVLVFDEPRFLTDQLAFKHRYELKPKKNDFQLVDRAFMSNKIGERWAIATIKNLASGRRSLKNDHVVATFADGSQSTAKNVNVTFAGGELLTVPIFLGVHKFPLVRIQTE